MTPKPWWTWIAVGGAALCVTAAIGATTRPRPAATPAPSSFTLIAPERFVVTRQVMPNGLTLLLHEDHSVPVVTFWQWFKVGSRNETPGHTGISHFFEHMMFNGSTNVAPKEYDRLIESNGGTSNAFTDRDMTAYYEDIASDRLEVLFRLDSDRMRGLLLAPEQLKSELEVVREERRLRVENDIDGMLDEALYAKAFVASPYRWPVLGWPGDLDRIQRDEMVAYFRTHYAPNNCIMALCGDFDTRQALALITRYFGDIPSQPAPAAPADSEPEQREERRVAIRYPAENVSFEVGYKAPSASSPDVWTLDLLEAILGDGESSRLHRALVYERQIALDATATFKSRLQPGLFELDVEMKPGRTAAEGEAVLDSVLAQFMREGPTEREVEKARNLLQADLVRALKTNNGAGEQLAFFEHVFGDYRRLFDAGERYRRVTAADCRRVAREVFVPERRTIAEIAPVADTVASKP